jgi:hypothetical protein
MGALPPSLAYGQEAAQLAATQAVQVSQVASAGAPQHICSHTADAMPLTAQLW